MPAKTNLFSRLLKAFSISVKRDTSLNKSNITPGEIDKETDKMRPVEFTSDIKKIWEWWLHQTTDNADTLKNRLDRYKDLDYMYYTDTIISSAAELYADEAVQYDSQNQPLLVNAKNKKVIKFINEMFERIGINQQSLREISRNLALYGDSFNVNSIEDKIGYVDSLVVDVTTVKDRIEFNAIDAKKKMMQFRNLEIFISRDFRLQQLKTVLDGTMENSKSSIYYKSYLFGYQLEDDLYLAPWNVTHFRLFSSKSEFYPYGRSLFINSISPFRQLKASLNLMALGRAAKFPKEFYEIATSDNMTESEKWAAVSKAKEEFHNLSYNEGAKEDFAVGGQIWAPEGLLKYTLMQNNMNLDDIADIEFLRENEILGTKVPKGYLIVDKASWGTSSQALLQQYKPFGRSVLQVQQAILRELIQMVKVQFIITGQFPADEPFELSMNYPIIEDAKDRLDLKMSTLELTKAVLNSLSTALGINGKLPTDVVKDIFTKYSFLGSDDIDNWIKDISNDNQKLSEDDNKKLKRLNEDIIREVYFKCKKELNLVEGLQRGRHYMTSWSKDRINEQTLDLLQLKKEDFIGTNKKKI